MSLTKDKITPGRTYAVSLGKYNFGPKFQAAVDTVKAIGGKYDGETKVWTVIIGDAVTETFTCRSSAHGPDPLRFDVDADGQCKRCGGTGQVEHTENPRELRELRDLADRYGAEVTAVDDGGRAVLEAERACLLARLAEISALLGEDA